ncbi:MAG: chemotaxis protein CheW [Syntrophobacteraceae bacterium]|nr:chemotaxis protein CheW [Syntrophobacteraceae bacterium]
MQLNTLSAQAPRMREEARQMLQLVSFRIGREEFGVNILMVQEIIRFTTITPIPNASQAILGMINLRGRIIPVVDLRWVLRIGGKEESAPDRKSRILIIELEGHVTGFVVDAVSEVLKVPVAEIEPTPSLLISSINSAYISGVVKLAQRLIILLDFKQILKPREKREFDNNLGIQAALLEYENAHGETTVFPAYQITDQKNIKE